MFSGHGAEVMWLMCIPPLVGWFGLAWIICTHERVTCFNYKRLLDWAALNQDDDDPGESIGARDERRSLELAARKLAPLDEDAHVEGKFAASDDAATQTADAAQDEEATKGEEGHVEKGGGESKPASPRHLAFREVGSASRPRGRTNSLERNLNKARRYEAKSFRHKPGAAESAAASRRASASASRAASRAASRSGSPAPSARRGETPEPPGVGTRGDDYTPLGQEDFTEDGEP